MNLPLIAQDKANHFIYGLVIFMLASLAFGAIYGLAAAVLIGAAKEVYDRVSKKGCPDVFDFIATGAGGLLGYACTLL